jgi:hypothetical protein
MLPLNRLLETGGGHVENPSGFKHPLGVGETGLLESATWLSVVLSVAGFIALGAGLYEIDRRDQRPPSGISRSRACSRKSLLRNKGGDDYNVDHSEQIRPLCQKRSSRRIERLLSQHGIDYVRGYVAALKEASTTP